MIGTKQNEKGELLFRDETPELIKENGQEVLDLVQEAMKAGLTEFVTPTTEDGQGRIEWRVARWVTRRAGKLACFLVAYKVLNAHFEVIGPEVTLPNGADTPNPKAR